MLSVFIIPGNKSNRTDYSFAGQQESIRFGALRVFQYWH